MGWEGVCVRICVYVCMCVYKAFSLSQETDS